MIEVYRIGNTDYSKNGDMTLIPESAVTHTELNGAWEAEIQHPIDQEGRWKYITEGAVIKMPSFNGNQLYRIKSREKEDSGITAVMEPIFYDSIGDCWLTDVRPTGKNGQEALDIMLSSNGKYSASSNISTANTAYYQYVNFMEALNGDIDQAFTKRWGGEILFDNFAVIVNERVGGEYGVELRYGKNIPVDGLKEEIDLSNVVTRIYPKSYNGYTMSNNGYVDSPLIQGYPVVTTKTITFDDVKMREDAQENDEENGVIICDNQVELDEALRKKCQEQYDSGIDKPTVTIAADMVLLQNTEQYKEYKVLERVSLGDTVHIIHNRLGIKTDARVIELEYDSIRKKVKSVVLGDFAYNYFGNVTSGVGKINSIVRPDGSVMAERVQGILNGIYTQLKLQSTAAEKVDGVAFKVEDLDPESPLYGCMIWGTQGIQISVTPTEDGRDWDWTTAITAKGIVADAIITGILSDKAGRNYWNLDTGEFRLSSEAFLIDEGSLNDYVDAVVKGNMTQEQVFRALTDNGRIQGIFMKDGQLYINGEYMKANSLEVGALKAGVGANLYTTPYDSFEQAVNEKISYFSGSSTPGAFIQLIVGDYGNDTENGVKALYGNKCLRYLTTGTSDTYAYLGHPENGYGCIPVQTGKTYIASCYMTIPASHKGRTVPTQLFVVEHTGKNGTNSDHPVSVSMDAEYGVWKRMQVSFTAREEYPYISLRLDVDTNAIVFFDCLQVEEVEDADKTAGSWKPAGAVIIDGNNITAGSITADKIYVTDLKAFNATIGNWHIEKDYLWTLIEGMGYGIIKSVGDVMIAANSPTKEDTTGATWQLFFDGHMAFGDTAGGKTRSELYGDRWNMYNDQGFAFRVISVGGAELYGDPDQNPTPYFDWHYNGDTGDYSVRMICTGYDTLEVQGGTLNTGSDEVLKEDVSEFDKKMETFFKNVNPIYYRYKTGTHKKQFGYSANNIEEALIKAGFDPSDIGLYSVDAKGVRSLAIGGMDAPNTYMIQKLLDRVLSLENEIIQLKMKGI